MTTTADLLAALATIDGEVAAAECRVTELRLERRGAEALLKRLGVSVTVDAPLDAETIGPRAVSVPRRGPASGNAEIVAKLLGTRPTGATLAVLVDMASQQGTPLENDQVRSAVAYLNRRGEVERLSRGLWRLAASGAKPDSSEPSSPAPTGGQLSLPDPNGSGSVAPEGAPI